MNTVVDILVKARKLLSDKKRWTQGAYCRGAGGCIIMTMRGEMRHAVVQDEIDTSSSYSALAAIWAVLEPNDTLYSPVVLLARYTSGSIGEFNDTHTHEEVLALFDRAIAENR